MISSTSTGLASASSFFRRALEADHGEIAVGQWPVFFHRAISGMLLPQIVERCLDVFVGDGGIDGADANVIVGSELEFGQDFE